MTWTDKALRAAHIAMERAQLAQALGQRHPAIPKIRRLLARLNLRALGIR